jgi:hypothetical protein
MKQATSIRTQLSLADTSFHAKSAGVSLVVVMTIGIFYFGRLLQLDASGASLPEGFLSLVLTTILLLIVVESVLQIVLVIGVGRVSAVTQRDRSIGLQATRNVYAVMSVGVVITFGMLFFNPSLFIMGNILLLTFMLAEITKSVAQIIGYRQSA